MKESVSRMRMIGAIEFILAIITSFDYTLSVATAIIAVRV